MRLIPPCWRKPSNNILLLRFDDYFHVSCDKPTWRRPTSNSVFYSKFLEFSENGRCVSSSPLWNTRGYIHALSEWPTDDFAVEVMPRTLGDEDDAHYSGCVHVGFAVVNWDNPSIVGYSIYPFCGNLFLFEHTTPSFVAICSPACPAGVIRCTRDPARGTISYTVNGVNYPAAFKDVPPGPMYMWLAFSQAGIAVRLRALSEFSC